MRIKTLIKKLEALQAKEGNLEVFQNWDSTGPGSISSVRIEEFDEYERLHKDWNMPKKWIELVG